MALRGETWADERGPGDRARGLELWINRLQARSELSDADVKMLLQLDGQSIVVERFRDFVRPGEVNEHTCVVVAGLAARFGQSREGQRQVSALYVPGDAADLHAVVLPRSPCSLTALYRSVILKIPRREIEKLAITSPTLAFAFWRDCAVDASIASEWIINNSFRPARARLAHLICELSTRRALAHEPALDFALEMTQEMLGNVLGLTSVHVNRMLRELRELRLVEVKGGVVTIFDLRGLQREGEFDPAYLHLEPHLEERHLSS